MNLTVNGYNIFLIIFVTFLSSLIVTPIVKKIAWHVKAIDYPNERRINKKPMPTIGGLAVFFSFMLGYILFAKNNVQMLSILMASFLLIMMGLIDDINPLKAKYQFIVQLLAACIVVFYGNITFQDMMIFGKHLTFGWASYPITIGFIVAIINAIDLSDGLDGLCSGSSCIYFATIAILAYIMNQMDGLDTILVLIMLGSTLGFLVYNFPPAKMYLGDTGSNFLGFIIAVTSLLGFRTATITSLIIPLLVLFVPIFDTAIAIARRVLKGNNPFNTPDKEHLHHQLLRTTKSPTKTVLLMYCINILFAAVSILYTLGDQKSSMILYICLLLFFTILIFKTNILYEHVSDKVEDKKVKTKKGVKK